MRQVNECRMNTEQWNVMRSYQGFLSKQLMKRPCWVRRRNSVRVGTWAVSWQPLDMLNYLIKVASREGADTAGAWRRFPLNVPLNVSPNVSRFKHLTANKYLSLYCSKFMGSIAIKTLYMLPDHLSDLSPCRDRTTRSLQVAVQDAE